MFIKYYSCYLFLSVLIIYDISLYVNNYFRNLWEFFYKTKKIPKPAV